MTIETQTAPANPIGWLSDDELPDDGLRLDPNLTGPKPEQVREAVAGDHPVMAHAPDPFLELPHGLRNNDVLQTQVETRELVGTDEERIARFKTSGEMLKEVVARGTVAIGNVDFTPLGMDERKQLLGNLLVGERWMIYLAIVRTTFGNEKTIEFKCGKCGSESSTTILMDEDFPPKVPDDLSMIHEYTTKSGDKLVYRQVLCRDLDELDEANLGTQAERNSFLLSILIQNINGDVPLNPEQYAKDLGLADRDKLLAQIFDNQVTVDLSLNPPCSRCNEEVVIPLAWEDLFRP